ncbi:hypothetical protein LUZ61_016062 [Rhynchospora tenuis]|uniref:F-box domain-containing protein n=1 Tax=Rhynchospora tenuis TaxID=198213 RepID=A0AAD6EJQ0_9POAL|nr:hypothetical protein LUZ61_016062 [Rhynchospora tenuis]
MSEQVEESNWSELPSELIHLIVKKLPDLVDFIRLCAVCTTWRSSAPLSDPPHQFPWLLELFKRGDYFYIVRKRQRFYSLTTGETLTIPLRNKKPKLRTFVDGGIYSGYLPFHDYSKRTLSLFNPLTRDLFSPPPMKNGYLVPWMVLTGADPIRNRTIVDVDRDLDIINEIGGWAFYDPHCKKWIEKWGYLYHCCYWQGMFFSTRVHEPTQVFDAHSRELLHEIPPPEIESRENWYDIGKELRKSYLVVSSGVILRVVWHHDYLHEQAIEESVFYIYRLDFERAENKSRWVQIYHLGDQILFLCEMNGFSMTARPNCGFSKGCIYFIDPRKHKPYMYDVLAGTVERVPCPFEKCTWFLPGL